MTTSSMAKTARARAMCETTFAGQAPFLQMRFPLQDLIRRHIMKRDQHVTYVDNTLPGTATDIVHSLPPEGLKKAVGSAVKCSIASASPWHFQADDLKQCRLGPSTVRRSRASHLANITQTASSPRSTSRFIQPTRDNLEGTGGVSDLRFSSQSPPQHNERNGEYRVVRRVAARLLSSSTIVVTDCDVGAAFPAVLACTLYADWCGPCKMIAPTFESLSTKFSKPGKITFCKVNVDNHQSIAQSHGVSAMPTFLVFKNGSVIETIRGANPPALTAAVEKVVKLVGTAAPGASFAMPGRTLGGSGSTGGNAPARRGGNSTRGGRSWMNLSPFNFINSLLAFFGLYIVSLLSFDPYKAAERSDFNVNKPRVPPAPIKLGGNRPTRGASAPGRPGGGVRTLADLGGS
ncbi:hypothetical protein NUW58_g9814 [Xylaria curta]|uniref:Uncharacterized protein n=1 Tax=Xylaria curta TaxID=42375 RepID=A0ACC1MSS2_9PEZI|nr:hypothetical protein NUW58_g9814 [Xylaria curta]